MILADFECRKGHVSEHLVHTDCKYRKCPVCGGRAKRIISQSGQYLGNLDADWIKSVLEVVDKESTKIHTREFLRNPNRDTYKAWLRGEKLRPMERGEEKRPQVDYAALKERRDRMLMEKLRERTKLEITTQMRNM